MICNTGKPPSPLLKSLNNSTGKFSTRGTGFNNLSWDEQTHGLVKLIVHKLWQESFDKVVAGAKEITKKTCSSIHTEEVIDLTSDKPPEEFAMLIDLPSDEEDSKIAVIKNEPENEDRDNDGYEDGYGDGTAVYEDEEGAQFLWSS